MNFGIEEAVSQIRGNSRKFPAHEYFLLDSNNPGVAEIPAPVGITGSDVINEGLKYIPHNSSIVMEDRISRTLVY